MLRMKLSIKGKVQKVGFRYSVIDHVHSQKLAIVGYIRNLPDGTVEVIAEGEIEALKDLHRFCSKGSPLAEVREIEEELLPITKLTYESFELLTE